MIVGMLAYLFAAIAVYLLGVAICVPLECGWRRCVLFTSGFTAVAVLLGVLAFVLAAVAESWVRDFN
jgi:hypothetical protein